jgi:potassium efflux system protein
MGLGLQSIANNFISGVLLLLERPLRTGDTVTIGNNEGAVTYIGLRSLTVKTWDNQEVIIPNSEVISHPFTNWTYTDNIVRTALTVSIHQQNDIHQAHTLITQALKGHPEILPKPPPEVWLDALGPTVITFRIQYFTDLRSANRQAVKSNILFQIWDALRQAGIRFPGAAEVTKEVPGEG